MNENYKFIHHAFLRACDTMVHLLQKAVDFTHEKDNEAEILEAKLTPDMFPFIKQVQVFTDSVAGAVARGAGQAKQSMPDTEKTLAELITRTQKTKEFIKSINPDTVEGLENLKIKRTWMPEGMYFDDQTIYYLSNEKTTIKAVVVGVIAGGHKYIALGILFKVHSISSPI